MAEDKGPVRGSIPDKTTIDILEKFTSSDLGRKQAEAMAEAIKNQFPDPKRQQEVLSKIYLVLEDLLSRGVVADTGHLERIMSKMSNNVEKLHTGNLQSDDELQKLLDNIQISVGNSLQSVISFESMRLELLEKISKSEKAGDNANILIEMREQQSDLKGIRTLTGLMLLNSEKRLKDEIDIPDQIEEITETLSDLQKEIKGHQLQKDFVDFSSKITSELQGLTTSFNISGVTVPLTGAVANLEAALNKLDGQETVLFEGKITSFDNALKKIKEELVNSGQGVLESLDQGISDIAGRLGIEREEAEALVNAFGNYKNLSEEHQKVAKAKMDEILALNDKDLTNKIFEIAHLNLQNKTLEEKKKIIDELLKRNDNIHHSTSMISENLSTVNLLTNRWLNALPMGLRNMMGMGNVLNAMGDGMRNVASQSAMMLEEGKSLGSVLASIPGQFNRAFKAVAGPMGWFILILGIIARQFMTIIDEVKGISEQFNIATDDAKKLNNQIIDIVANSKNEYVTRKGTLSIMEKHLQVTGQILDLTNKTNMAMIEQASEIGAKFGVAAEEVHNLQLMLQHSVGASVELTQGMINTLANASKLSGISFGNVMKDLAENAKTAALYFHGMPDDLIKTAMRLQLMGASMKDLAGVMDATKDISGSYINIFELFAMTGGAVDASRLLDLRFDPNATKEDIMDEVMRIYDDLESSNQLNEFTLGKLSATVGIDADQLKKMAAVNKLDSTRIDLGKEFLGQLSLEEIQNQELFDIRVGELETTQNWQRALAKVSATFKRALLPTVETLGDILEGFLPIIDLIGFGVKVISYIFRFIGWTLQPIGELIAWIGNGIRNWFRNLEMTSQFWQDMKAIVTFVREIGDTLLGKITRGLLGVVILTGLIKGNFLGIPKIIGGVTKSIWGMLKSIGKAPKQIIGMFKSIGGKEAKGLAEQVQESGKKLVNTTKYTGAQYVGEIENTTKDVKGAGDSLKDSTDKLGKTKTSFLERIGDSIKNFFDKMAKLDKKGVINFAIIVGTFVGAVAILAGALLIISQIEKDKMLPALGTLAGVMILAGGAMWASSKLFNSAGDELLKAAIKMALFAIVIGVIAGALWLIQDVGIETLIGFGITLLAASALMFAAGTVATAAAPMLLAFAAVIIAIAAGILIGAYAFSIFADSLLKLKEGMSPTEFILFGDGLMLFSTALIAASISIWLLAASAPAALIAATAIIGLAGAIVTFNLLAKRGSKRLILLGENLNKLFSADISKAGNIVTALKNVRSEISGFKGFSSEIKAMTKLAEIANPLNLLAAALHNTATGMVRLTSSIDGDKLKSLEILDDLPLKSMTAIGVIEMGLAKLMSARNEVNKTEPITQNIVLESNRMESTSLANIERSNLESLDQLRNINQNTYIDVQNSNDDFKNKQADQRLLNALDNLTRKVDEQNKKYVVVELDGQFIKALNTRLRGYNG